MFVSQTTTATLTCSQKLIVNLVIAAGSNLVTESLDFTVPCIGRYGLPCAGCMLESSPRHLFLFDSFSIHNSRFNDYAKSQHNRPAGHTPDDWVPHLVCHPPVPASVTHTTPVLDLASRPKCMLYCHASAVNPGRSRVLKPISQVCHGRKPRCCSCSSLHPVVCNFITSHVATIAFTYLQLHLHCPCICTYLTCYACQALHC